MPIVGPAQICSSSAACCGSISTSQPRTFRTLINSVVYVASQWSGWMFPAVVVPDNVLFEGGAGGDDPPEATGQH